MQGKVCIVTHRYAKPEELTALVAFLAAEESNFVTSQLILFYGGWAS